ncbi:MAG TPA: response regulator [Verrucomicrobiae bacterium]|nr:response regulator [Verrucomicrobiae bacterium]
MAYTKQESPQAEAAKSGSLPGSAAEKKNTQLPTILIVDDDEAMRGLLRTRLSDAYRVVETGEPEQALALAMEHKPQAILLDLMMPKCSGFELCQTLHSLSYTSRIPIFVITGEAGAKYREYCESLGARGYFQKPVEFAALRTKLDAEIGSKQPERRAHVRVRMRVFLKLKGIDSNGAVFEVPAATENVSAGGFLCGCTANFVRGAVVEVFLAGEQDRYAGRAEVVRRESPGAPWQRYGFRFQEITNDWVLQPA